MSGFVMRPSRLDDYDVLMSMAVESGPGFTSLPIDEDRLRDRLNKSGKAFEGRLEHPEYGKYLMMMEHIDSGEVAGASAVKAGIGIEYPFFNYRIITLAQASLAAERRFDMDALVLTNESVGYTEVGTLFVRKAHRGGGSGRLAAQSRYLLMETEPEKFGDTVLAELRGVVSEDGISPFWECLGRHFFRMSFQEADYLSATSDNQFILDLMPKYPIYVDLLPAEAREVIGRCHADGVGALKLLEWEGFQFERVVDIFDGGPMVTARRSVIRTGRESQMIKVEAGEVSSGNATGLISNNRLSDFRACHLDGALRGDGTMVVPPGILEALRLKPGNAARVWVKT